MRKHREMVCHIFSSVKALCVSPHYSQPGDLQVEFDGAQVVDVHGHHLGHGGEQLLGLADHRAHQDVGGQPLQLRHLEGERFTTTSKLKGTKTEDPLS